MYFLTMIDFLREVGLGGAGDDQHVAVGGHAIVLHEIDGFGGVTFLLEASVSGAVAGGGFVVNLTFRRDR